MPSPQDILLPGGRPIGAAGTDPSIREVAGDTQEAEELFDELTAGGADVTPSNYPGKLMALPGGGHVGLRPASKSGPPTIDVNVPGIPIRKVKFVGGTS